MAGSSFFGPVISRSSRPNSLSFRSSNMDIREVWLAAQVSGITLDGTMPYLVIRSDTPVN